MKIWVNKLGYGTSSDDLLDLFEKYGDVDSVEIMMDNNSERSKALGCVEMPDPEEAYEAMGALNTYELNGREMSLTTYDPRDRNNHHSRHKRR